MSIVVVTGTGTEVGKTVGTAALAAVALARGERVTVVKPVQTGVRDGEPGDVHEVARLLEPLGARLDLSDRLDTRELYRLPEPMAPQAAAERAGEDLPELRSYLPDIEKAARSSDLVLVEGAGGVLVRLDGAGAAGGTIADLAVLLGAEVVVVTGPGLGTLNVTELTVEALRARAASVRGVLVSRWPADPGAVERQNLVDLPRLTGVPLLGVVPELAPGESPTISS